MFPPLLKVDRLRPRSRVELQYNTNFCLRALLESLPPSCFILERKWLTYWPPGRSDRKSIRASRYEIWWKSTICDSHPHTHTHTHTSAWNVVGASAAKRTENGVRERSGEERGGHEGERDQWKEYEWKGREERMQRYGHKDSKPGDDGLKTEDLQ